MKYSVAGGDNAYFIHGLGGELLADYVRNEFIEFVYWNRDMLFR